MTEPIEPGGRDPTPATTHEDGLPTGGHSITAARALSAPTTVDRAARTVEVVWSTGARARNFVPPLGMITEELDMSPNAVRMGGLRGGGAPVLNTHRRADARDVVGRVVAARLEAGRGYATLQFSSATDVEPLWQRIADGRINQINGNITSETYRRLELTGGMDVMEIGPANGRLLPELLQMAPDLRYVGIDISPTMVEEARLFNADRVVSGQAAFHHASADRMPVADASFHRVFAINVIYFWPDAVRPLREIRRVLRPSGFSLIAAGTPETMTGNSVFSLENGFHLRDADTLVALHKEAGFSHVAVDLVSEVVKRPDGTPWTRHYNMVTARP